jgi:hypothetical protein
MPSSTILFLGMIRVGATSTGAVASIRIGNSTPANVRTARLGRTVSSNHSSRLFLSLLLVDVWSCASLPYHFVIT